MSSRNHHTSLSRRSFLKGVGVLTAAGATVAATGCETTTTIPESAIGTGNAPTAIPVPVQYPGVPYTPTEPPPLGVLRVFTPHEARTVEALTARLIPGTPADPGAREAGVVYYIDNFLAYQEGFPEPTYRSGAYAQTFDPASPLPEAVQWYQQQGLPLPQPSGGSSESSGQASGGQGGPQSGQGGQNAQSSGQQSQPTPTPPLPQDNLPTPTSVGAANPGAQLAATATAVLGRQYSVPTAEAGTQQATPVVQATTTSGGGTTGQNTFQVVWIPADQVERYGYQSILTPREVYRIGLAAVDRYANSTVGHDFINLTEQQQDQIVGDMAEGQATGFDRSLSAQAFFHNLRRHTTEGMFSDPVYGGNRDMIGWKLVGFPGAQRAYDASEFQHEGTTRQPQSIQMLHPFNPGQNVNDQVILPVSGSQPDHQQPPAPPAEQMPRP